MMKLLTFYVALSLFSFFTFAHFSTDKNTETSPDKKSPSTDNFAIHQSNYLWPTNASKKITSSFAEFRTTHFHGGIDISTNGQKGFKVFAPQNGYVYRIVISPNGYGKMLYVKHSDGYFTAYAHLSGYNEAITRVAREEQYRKGTYAIDITLTPQQIPVKQADVIAYTGDTGFGPPHLHFEVRDENLDQINPLLINSYRVPDNIPPKIKRLLISPLTYGSTVDNYSRPKLLTRFNGRKHEFYIPQAIRVHGDVGFGIDAVDLVNGTWTKSGIHRIEFYLDDSLTYTMQLDRVPVRETKQISLHYDFPSLLFHRGHFQKLYVDVGNALPFYGNYASGSGIITTGTFTEGFHTFQIVCKDVADNQTVLSGKLFFNRKPTIEVASFDNNRMTLTGDNIESVTKCVVYEKKTNENSWSQRTFSQKSLEKTVDKIFLTFDKKENTIFKVVAETKNSSKSDPAIYFGKKFRGIREKVAIETELLGDYATVTLTTKGIFTKPPHVILKESENQKTIEVNAVDVNKYIGMFLPTASVAGIRNIEVEAEVNGVATKTHETFTTYPLSPNTSGSFSVDNNLSISYDSGAVFNTLYMQVIKENVNGLTVYELEPADVLLNRGIKCSLLASNDNEKGAGLYFRSTGGWSLQNSKLDSEHKSYSTKLMRTLGDLTLIRDNIPPSIGKLRVQPLNKRVNVFFRYYDNRSGVDPDEIKMYIDKKLVIPEIDDEHKKATYQSTERLERGKHTLHIMMKDRMKNETELTRSFFVK